MAASSMKSVISLLLVAAMGTLAGAQTVLYDFQNEPAENGYPDTFGHFGTITMGSGLIQDCGGVPGEVCRYHVGNFDDLIPDPSRFGLIEIGPKAPELLLDMTGFVGYSVSARFIRDVDNPPDGFADFNGTAPLEIGLQWDPDDPCAGSMDACSDVYAAPVELTETFTTYSVMFKDFVPPGTPLNSVQIKMLLKTGLWDGSVLPAVKLEDYSSGIGRLEFDNIIGILPTLGDMDCDGDVDFDDIDDFVLGLTDAQEYENQNGVPPAFKGDTDGDGDFDFDDIPGFVNILTNPGGLQAIPEPASLVLLLVGLAGLVTVRQRMA